MGVLSRISALIKSNLNDLISKAEDPEKILEQSLVDMRENLKEAKGEVVSSLANQKVLEKKLATAAEDVTTWEAKAMLAVQSGDDDLAREALKRKAAAEGRRAALEEQVNVQKDYVDTLRASLTALDQKIDEAKAKKDQLVTRLKAAKVKEDMIAAREAVSGSHKILEDDGAFAAFARMEDKILQIEGKVEAMEELSAVETGADKDIRKELEIENRLKQLKASNVADGIEDELEQLKKRITGRTAGSDGASAADAADGSGDPVEDELAELKRRVAGEAD